MSWNSETLEQVEKLVQEQGTLTQEQRQTISKQSNRSLRAVANLEYQYKEVLKRVQQKR